MDIILRRDVKTKTFRLLMDIHKSGKREDIIAILMLAAENDGQVGPEDICMHLIANRPVTVGERIIQRCVELGVLEKQNRQKTNDFMGFFQGTRRLENETIPQSIVTATLTDEGRRAVEKKRVFLPERGLYQILYSDDPLLPSPLLDCIPDDKKSDKDENREEIDFSIRTSLENRYFKTLGKERNEIFVERIEQYGRQISTKKDVSLTYSLLENGNVILRLNGDLETKLEPPKYSQMEIWYMLVESMGISDDWDSNTQCLRRGFEELKQKDIVNFTTGLRTNSLAIEGMGEFNDVEVKGVPIIPRTQRDAQRWAIWLLKNEINDYAKSHEYEDIVQRIRNKFPGYDINLPSQVELARMIREEAGEKLPPSYWYLKAPIDIAYRSEAL
ncbi:MAG: hypothetical protein AWU59_846 [Methanolobus sp. T82-4]|nr:MAG: hypothetical protein AWU59_846 [Methanolobus sp. T82-4]